MRRMRVSRFMTVLEPYEAPPGDLCPIEKCWLSPTDTLEDALRAFDRSGASRIPVVSSSDPDTVIGWADRSTAISSFNRALIAAHEEEHR